MATESIFRNIVLKEQHDIENFVKAMEKAQELSFKTDISAPEYEPIPKQALDVAIQKFVGRYASLGN